MSRRRKKRRKYRDRSYAGRDQTPPMQDKRRREFERKIGDG
jgi:hypothetical protein